MRHGRVVARLRTEESSVDQIVSMMTGVAA